MQVFYPTLNRMNGRTTPQEGVRDTSTIQLKQPPTERLRMASILEQLLDMYTAHPQCFPVSPATIIGNDHKIYSTKSIFRDLKKCLAGWKDTTKNNHIYKSFVDRHNWLVDNVARGLANEGYNQDAQRMIDQLYISYKQHQIIPSYYTPLKGVFE